MIETLTGFWNLLGLFKPGPHINQNPAQLTHVELPGKTIIRPNGIGLPHFRHFPKSGLSKFWMDKRTVFISFSDIRSAASFTLLLLMASIRLTLPISHPGGIGWVSSLSVSIFVSSFSFSLASFLNTCCFSVSVIWCFVAMLKCDNAK